MMKRAQLLTAGLLLAGFVQSDRAAAASGST